MYQNLYQAAEWADLAPQLFIASPPPPKLFLLVIGPRNCTVLRCV